MKDKETNAYKNHFIRLSQKERHSTKVLDSILKYLKIEKTPEGPFRTALIEVRWLLEIRRKLSKSYNNLTSLKKQDGTEMERKIAASR